MPQKTRLALINERAATNEEEARLAGVALAEAEAAEHPIADPQAILAALRGQLAETTQIAASERARADAAEHGLHQASQEIAGAKADQAKVREAAQQEVARIRQDAAASVATIEKQANAAERAALAAGVLRQVVTAAAQLISFLVDRTPVIGTLTGGFLLTRAVLPDPTMTQLAALAIYGVSAIAPAIWLSARK